MEHLSALPVAIPFLAGPLLVVTGSIQARWFHDSWAALCAVAVTTMCTLLLVHAWRAPHAYWIGGFLPRHGVAIGISLSIDPLGGGDGGVQCAARDGGLGLLAALLRRGQGPLPRPDAAVHGGHGRLLPDRRPVQHGRVLRADERRRVRAHRLPER